MIIANEVTLAFMSKVKKTDTCWIWQGAKYNSGYGRVYSKIANLAHRLSYYIFHGELSNNLIVMHSCDVRLCVNPAHLSQGTHKDNTQDMIKKGRKFPQLGSTNPASKLTVKDIREIRFKHFEGAIQTHLAKEYGVSPSLINLIVKYKNWRQL